MRRESYKIQNNVQKNHWWYHGRRELFYKLISNLNLSPKSKILDAGCGSGGNIDMLKDLTFKKIFCLDISPDSIKYLFKFNTKNLVGKIEKLPFKSNSFDLVLATDVLEHIDHDSDALDELYRVLCPGGKIIITVPAFMSLWGPQDIESHHKRRYKINTLKRVANKCGLSITKCFYFNFILFFHIWLVRKLLILFNLPIKNENLINTNLMNKILFLIFRYDVRFAGFINPPFGVSILLVGEKK